MNGNQNSLAEIAQKLNESKNVAVFCHVRPDGDALGSGLALTTALKNAGKNAFMLCEDEPPEKFSFLPLMKTVLQELPNLEWDTFVSVDCGDMQRMGKFAEKYQKLKGVTLNIDHHISNIGYAKYNYVCVCPATCELLPEILEQAGYSVTPDIAQLLMMGLITDSGNFTHQDVSAKTFQTAANLRAAGADVTLLNDYLFARQPKARALLYGKVMSKIRFELDDKLDIITITQKDLEAFGADRSMTEGFVDFPLTIEGVEVAIAILEVKTGQYKVSLRSKGRVNVNEVAASFGGGGHILASGCMLFGEYEEVVDKLRYAIYQQL
jgi:phosphoesterase RecJ-like protein